MSKDVYAQRILVNELVLTYHKKTKRVNDVISAFKALTKTNNSIVAFYLFMAEIYRLHNHPEAVRFNSDES